LKGRDPDLGRDLAMKVLLEQHRENPDLVRRFVEEAQIGGQLQHPGIVPIYELGTFGDTRPYFTMKLVKGRTLAALLAERRSSGPTYKPEAPAKGWAEEPSLALQACGRTTRLGSSQASYLYRLFVDDHAAQSLAIRGRGEFPSR